MAVGSSKKAKASVQSAAKRSKATTKPVPKQDVTPAVTDMPKPKRTYPAWLKRTYKFIAHALVVTSLPEALLVATLCYSRYLENSDFSYPSEVIITIVLLSLVLTPLFYIIWACVRSWRAAHLAAIPLTYALYAYSYSFPSLHHLADHLVSKNATSFEHMLMQLLVFIVVFGLIGFLIDVAFRRIKQLKAVPLLKYILFVVCFIFAAEMVKVGSRMWTIRHDLLYKEPKLSFQQTSKPSSKPDVYYLLFDRYASETTLTQDYHYDNSAFLNNLTSEGFVTRDNAYANYPFTMQSISSTLAASYHNQLNAQFKDDAVGFQTGFPYRTILDNPPVAQAFKANGYTFNQVSSWWDFTRNSPSADSEPSKSFKLHALGKDYWLTDLQRDIVNKSILSPLLLKGMSVGHTQLVKYTLDRNPTENFDAEMNALKNIAINSSEQKQPQFTFAHVLSPHDPYVFDADCDAPSYDPNRTDDGIDETQKYTNQVTCINKSIEDLVHTIRTKDPDAAIIMQADEGPYPKEFRGTLTLNHYYDPINLPLAQMQQKFGVLASYYMPGVDSQTVNSGITANVNAFRFVLSHYLGYNLPPLPDCQFSTGDKFSLYNFQLVTDKLKDTPNPSECWQYK